jgi:hypothetical protein
MNNAMQKTGTMTAMAIVALCALFAPSARACGSAAHRLAAGGRLSALPLTALPEPALERALPEAAPQDDSGPLMTGLWKTVFKLSDGSVVNVGFNMWHSDGTEWALDSAVPPALGDVCLGVWEHSGPRTFDTIHSNFNVDPTGTTIVSIFEERLHVTLSANGDSWAGSFTWDCFTFSGTRIVDPANGCGIGGTATGARIKVGAPLPFPFPL